MILLPWRLHLSGVNKYCKSLGTWEIVLAPHGYICKPNPGEYAQPCLFLKHADNSIEYGQRWINPDSVLVDTCSTEPYEDRLYANRYYFLLTPYNTYPFDHVLHNDGEVLRPSDMLPSVQALKDSLISLERQVGPIYFIGLVDDVDSSTDSLQLYNPNIRFYFANYQPYNKIVNYISAFPLVRYCIYENRYLPYKTAVEKGEISNLAFPNPSRISVHLDYLPSGEEYNIYNSFGSLALFGSLSPDKTINVERLSPGIYLIVTKSGAERFVKE